MKWNKNTKLASCFHNCWRKEESQKGSLIISVEQITTFGWGNLVRTPCWACDLGEYECITECRTLTAERCKSRWWHGGVIATNPISFFPPNFKESIYEYEMKTSAEWKSIWNDIKRCPALKKKVWLHLSFHCSLVDIHLLGGNQANQM